MGAGPAGARSGLERGRGKRGVMERVIEIGFVHWRFASQSGPPSVLRGDSDWTTSGWLDRDWNLGLAFQRAVPWTYQKGRERGRGFGGSQGSGFRVGRCSWCQILAGRSYEVHQDWKTTCNTGNRTWIRLTSPRAAAFTCPANILHMGEKH